MMVSMKTMWEREECSLAAVAPTERFWAARVIRACSRSCAFTCSQPARHAQHLVALALMPSAHVEPAGSHPAPHGHHAPCQSMQAHGRLHCPP